jgi:hypothetical protein
MRISIQQILQGPTALENALTTQIPQSPQEGRSLSWLNQIINTLQSRKPGFWKKDKIAYHFTLGYAFQQAANLATPDSPEKKALLEGALTNFKAIQKWPKKYAELAFYVINNQAQTMTALGQEWPEVEEVCLDAFEIHPTRAESLVQIIKHYLTTQEWPIAYIFSSYCREHHYDHFPTNDHWGLDPELYNWKLLDMHTAVCFNMGNMEEASLTFNTLMLRLDQQPQLFTDEQITKLREKKALFQQEPA